MKFIIDILRGCAIGIANVIPGVSGGTLAVSMGIYDKIINSVNNLFKKFKQSILTLLPYGIGVIIGIVGLSFAITAMFEHLPLPTIMLFIGLIFGGIPLLWSKIKGKKIDAIAIILFVLFAAFLVVLPILTAKAGADKSFEPGLLTVLRMLFAGVLGAATMVIPGVSGSAIMMAIGYYNTIIGSIKGIVKALVAGDWASFGSCLFIIVPFAVGALVGILVIAKLIAYLLEKFTVYTYAAILGLVCASPYSIFTSVMNETGIPKPNALTIILSILTLAAGLAAAYFMSRSEMKEAAESENNGADSDSSENKNL